MEYNIDTFIIRLMELMTIAVPYEQQSMYDKKHKNRNGARLKDLFDPKTNLAYAHLGSPNIRIFDVGSEMGETITPHYHILENSPVIRKAGKGTKKSKGSQDLIKEVGKRDYEKVSFNGKTYKKEYAKNVRGKRNSVVNNAQQWITEPSGKVTLVNRDSNQYKNIHYQYIEKALNSGILDQLAVEFNMKRRARVQSSGLEEEYQAQIDDEYRTSVNDSLESSNNILDILNSFSESEEYDDE